MLYVEKFLITSFSLLVSVLSLWDRPLTWKTITLQCYYTVGWVIWPVKSSEMPYNMSSGTLKPTIPVRWKLKFFRFSVATIYIYILIMVKFGVVQHTIGPLYYVKFGPNWQRDGYRSSCKLENLLKLQLSADIRQFSLHMGDLSTF